MIMNLEKKSKIESIEECMSPSRQQFTVLSVLGGWGGKAEACPAFRHISRCPMTLQAKMTVILPSRQYRGEEEEDYDEDETTKNNCDTKKS